MKRSDLIGDAVSPHHMSSNVGQLKIRIKVHELIKQYSYVTVFTRCMISTSRKIRHKHGAVELHDCRHTLSNLFQTISLTVVKETSRQEDAFHKAFTITKFLVNTKEMRYGYTVRPPAKRRHVGVEHVWTRNDEAMGQRLKKSQAVKKL